MPLVECRAVISEPARTGSGNHAGKISPSETSSQRALEAHPLYLRLAELPRALIYLIKNWKSQGPAGGD